MEQNFIHYKNSLGRRYCTIRYLENNKALSIIWKGTATGESIKEVEDGIREFIGRHDCRAVIIDVQDFFDASTEFLTDIIKYDWIKKAGSNSDIRLIANVVSPGATIPRATPESVHGPEIRFFYHKLEAVEWVNNNILKG
ncbi:hypothetical protein [Pontibacter kalidii]|uniref:hypothetical protein n=1 Tax=Pontibacter kalidii TaxID=2592049 RepID=UPI00225708BB|nr:hypothetical protein [Pontibacter kalidii]